MFRAKAGDQPPDPDSVYRAAHGWGRCPQTPEVFWAKRNMGLLQGVWKSKGPGVCSGAFFVCCLGQT
jgi:hypothetical protein